MGVVHSLTPTENSSQADLLTLGVPIMTLCMWLSVDLVRAIRALSGIDMAANETALETGQAQSR